MTDGDTGHVDDPGPVEHVDLDTIADLQAGLLPAHRVPAIRAHLQGCARCAADADDLAAVPGRLAATGPVGPVPEDVARRLDDALARPPAPPAATVTPLPRRDRPALSMRVLQAAAVLVVVLAGVGIGYGAFQGGRDSADTSTAAGGAADAGADESREAGAFPVTASGQNFSPDTVVAAVPQIVGGTLGPAAPSVSAGAGEAPGGGDDPGRPSASAAPREQLAEDTARLAGGPSLADCVTALNDGPVTPLGVDLARWEGNPAVVIVLPTPGDPTTADAWVVAPDCGQADAKVLYFARVARP